MSKKKLSANNKTLSVRKLQQKYNLKIDSARESYKKEKGLSIARGFKQTNEYKKLQKAKDSAIKRKVKQINKGVSSTLFDAYDKSNQKPTKEVREKVAKQQGVTSPTDWIADHEIFYSVLSYGGKVKLIQTAKEKMENQGKEVTVTVFYPNGSSVTSSNEAQFLLNIERLYIALMGEEDKTGKYPLIDILSFGITPQKSAIAVRPVQESDWLEKAKK